MGCIETDKLPLTSDRLRRIKSNMGCIETEPDKLQLCQISQIKSNMRCIETSNQEHVQLSV